MNEVVNYVPATTRAVLAEFGGALSVQLGRKPVVLSSHELPGEIEWRVDLLAWYVKRLVMNAVRLTPQARMATLAHARAALLQEVGLHSMEAKAVVTSARQVLERLGFPGMTGPPEGFLRVDEDLEAEWGALQRRYSHILAACR
ncbi:hypothetical protein [Ralstonia pseudosolanacearum]